MVVGYTANYAISAYNHWCCEFESRSGWGVQHSVIKFVSDMWQVNGSSTNKSDRHDITEILLKVTLNTIRFDKDTFLHMTHFPEDEAYYLSMATLKYMENIHAHQAITFWNCKNSLIYIYFVKTHLNIVLLRATVVRCFRWPIFCSCYH